MPYTFNPSDRTNVFAWCFASSLLPIKTEGGPITVPVPSRCEMVATSPSRLSSIFRRTDIPSSCKSVRARDAGSLARLGAVNTERKSAVNQRPGQGRGQDDQTENPEQLRMRGLAATSASFDF